MIAKKKRMNYPSQILNKKMTALESSFDWEYYILMQMETMKQLTEETKQRQNTDFKDVKRIFETITSDKIATEKLLPR